MSAPVHTPRTREWHYVEADRLLERAAEVTKEFTEATKTVSAASRDKQAELATLAGMIARRSHAHAQLARTSEMVADDACSRNSEWLNA